jgi:hypothetical protein
MHGSVRTFITILTVFKFEQTVANMSNCSGNHLPRAMLEPRFGIHMPGVTSASAAI